MDKRSRKMVTAMWRTFRGFQEPGELEQRVLIAKTIERLAVDGKIWFYEWSRDCDCVEGDSITQIPATVMAYVKHRNEAYDNAEGPVFTYIMPAEQASTFQRSRRDRILEAFESGNTYSV